MVTRTYYEDYFRPFSLYFFDAPGERLVPGPRAPRRRRPAAHRPGHRASPAGPAAPRARSAPTCRARDAAAVGHGRRRGRGRRGVLDVADQAVRPRSATVWPPRSCGRCGPSRPARGAHLRRHARSSRPGASACTRSTPGEASGRRPANDHTYALVDDKLVEIDGATVRPGRRGVGTRRGAVPWRRRWATTPWPPFLPDATGADHRPGRAQDPLDVDGSRFVAPRGTSTTASGSSTGRPARPGCGSSRTDASAPSPPGPARADRAVVRPVARRRPLRLVGHATGWPGALRRAGATRPGRSVDVARRPTRLSIGVGRPALRRLGLHHRLGFLGASDAGVQLYDVALDGTDLLGGDTGGGPLLPDVDASCWPAAPDEDSARWVLDARRRLWFRPPAARGVLIDDRASPACHRRLSATAASTSRRPVRRGTTPCAQLGRMDLATAAVDLLLGAACPGCGHPSRTVCPTCSAASRRARGGAHPAAARRGVR